MEISFKDIFPPRNVPGGIFSDLMEMSFCWEVKEFFVDVLVYGVE